MENRYLFTREKREKCLARFVLMVENLRLSMKPNLHVTESLRQQILAIEKFRKIFKAAHIKYIVEEEDKELKDKASEEYQATISNSNNVLFPKDPKLEEIMAKVEDGMTDELLILRKFDFLAFYEVLKDLETSANMELPEENKSDLTDTEDAKQSELSEKRPDENSPDEKAASMAESKEIYDLPIKCDVCRFDVGFQNTPKNHKEFDQEHQKVFCETCDNSRECQKDEKQVETIVTNDGLLEADDKEKRSQEIIIDRGVSEMIAATQQSKIENDENSDDIEAEDKANSKNKSYHDVQTDDCAECEDECALTINM